MVVNERRGRQLREGASVMGAVMVLATYEPVGHVRQLGGSAQLRRRRRHACEAPGEITNNVSHLRYRVLSNIKGGPPPSPREGKD